MCEKCRAAEAALDVEVGEIVGVRMLVILKGDNNIYDVELHEGAEAVCKLVLAKLNAEETLKLTRVGSLVSEEKAKEMLAAGETLIQVSVPVDDEPAAPPEQIH